ncbi:MAG TPA: ferrochelatase [Stellaceae bacterium]|nr:ferrochelatase [Stellaceae bacterium]
MSKCAVVLFNLGGPDAPAAVRPFLFNLFNDAAIITLPQPLRGLIAGLIAWRRAPIARAIYDRIGGGSPLLANTEAQARALEAALGDGYRVFVAMRYWPPYSRAAAEAVKEWNAEQVVLLPLYPQYSTTTTGSSLADWRRAAQAVGLAASTGAVCCYPEEPGFIDTLAAGIREALLRWPKGEGRRVLLSAHGLPERIVAAGDPYPWQVERTAAALRAALGLAEVEIVVCYQSRVGPLAWIGPATDAEIRRAGGEGVGLIVVPIAFVSEHSETLVELDIEYRHLAASAGVPRYIRVPTAGTAPAFIAGLAGLVRRAKERADTAPCPGDGRRLCPPRFGGCRCRMAAGVSA